MISSQDLEEGEISIEEPLENSAVCDFIFTKGWMRGFSLKMYICNLGVNKIWSERRLSPLEDSNLY